MIVDDSGGSIGASFGYLITMSVVLVISIATIQCNIIKYGIDYI
jgi:hypothetical protein